jgi:hypothetical protein
MSRLYKDGKQFEPKPKGPKRKNAEELYVEHSTALLLKKINLVKQNIADEFLDDSVRNQKIIERAINLAKLHPFEMLIKLASTEIHLEATQFLLEETYTQKQFLEDEYRKLGEKRLIQAANKAAGKAKVQAKYSHVKEFVQKTLVDMKEPDYKLLLIKVRKNFSKADVSDNSISNYFKQITGLKSTK